MRSFIVIFAFLAMATVSFGENPVHSSTWSSEFDGSPPALEQGWGEWKNPTVLDGHGHVKMDSGCGMYRWTDAGGFDLEWKANLINMGGAPGADGYNIFKPQYWHGATNGINEYFIMQVRNMNNANAEDTWLEVGTITNTANGAYTQILNEQIGHIYNMVVNLQYREVGGVGTYTFNANVNNGSFMLSAVGGGFGLASDWRTEYIETYQGGGAPAFGVSLDYYHMTPVPEPATMLLLGIGAVAALRKRA